LLRLWTARLFGTAGSQMRTVAIGWQMYELTGSAWGLGLVGLYQFVPALLFTLVAGHVADRVHRGRINATCILMQAVVAGTLVAATVGQGASGPWVSRGVLLGVSVMLGLTRAFQMPAQQALTPSLLPPQLLPSGLAFSSAGIQCAIIAGPAIGGLLFLAGASVVYATCTLPPQLLPSGLAFSSAGIQCAIIAGPAIGGLLFVAGASVVYALFAR